MQEPSLIPTDFSEFDRYIRQGEPSQRERAQNWAIGLQAVDAFRMQIRWNHIVLALLMVLAVYFVFRK